MFEPIPRCSRPVLVRWLPLVLAAGTLCHASLATALGLGDLTLRSYLNQPLKADIVLSDTAGLEASEVTASIASADDYAKAGIERVFFLNDLRFTADFSGAQKVIHVTSSKAVTEPYLSFLVQVNRPGGQLLRTFTVLLDPPGTVALAAAPAAMPSPSPSRNQAPAAAKAPAAAARPPANKPAAASADAQTQRTIAQLQERLQNLQTEVDAKDQAVADLKNQLQQARQAAPVVAAIAATAPVAASTGSPSVPAATSTAASAAIPASPANAPVAAPATPASASVPAQAATPAPVATAPAVVTPAPSAFDDFDWLPVLGGVALLLLLALLLLRRRQQRRTTLVDAGPLPSDDSQGALAAPSQAPIEVLAAEPSVRSLPQQEPVAPVRRDSAPATDALDGASIYIAYGRFNEAIGILREGLAKQPERVDLRFRLLEVLGQQGDLGGFEEEERAALATGVTPERIQQIRAQSPKLEAAQAAAKAASVAATALAATAAAVAASAALAPRDPEPLPTLATDLDSEQPVGLAMNAVAEPDFDFDLDSSVDDDLELLASEPLEESAADEFQLNLDDLSMDADWEMVSPFEPAAVTRKPLAQLPTDAPIEVSDELSEPLAVDPLFTTNLRELPEVYEVADEQFLSDFAGLDDLGGFDDPALDDATVEEQPLPGALDSGDDDFLASFMSNDDASDLEAMSLDFDSLDSQQASAEKLEQAQGLIQDGDFHSASELLQGLLRDGDPSCQASARELLASLR